MMSDSDYEDYDYGSDANDSMSEGEYAFESQAQPSTRQAQYAVYSEAELRERQQQVLNAVTSVLSIEESDAARVLRACKWDANRVNEDWFTDTDAVRQRAGLQEPQPQPSVSQSAERICGICFEPHKARNMCSAGCAHYFCKDCWRSYIHHAVDDGPTCLNLRCPNPECKIAVPQSVLAAVIDSRHEDKHKRYAMRSFVEDNRRMTWCPGPNCEHAVESLMDAGPGPLDVACKCGHAFCFSCKEEAHRPVNCATVHKWLIKNSAESENLNWILAHTKQCPKCKRPIEKNQGCMHMTCSQCRHEFCWLCQGSWAEHGERTGGFYACNRYESAQRAGEYDEEAQKREQARNALERYMHYYQRWAENDASRTAARKEAEAASQQQLLQLSEATATPVSQLKFICDAWDQVVDCRRILKWTYTYGYYIFGEQSDQSTSAVPKDVLAHHQEFFEFNQGQAESYLEKLHGMAEKQLAEVLDTLRPHDATPFDPPQLNRPEWPKFRETLIGLTDVTRTHFRKLVEELEKGLTVMLNDYTIVEAMEAEQAPRPAEAGPSGEPAKPAKASLKSRASGGKRSRSTARGDRGRPRGGSPPGSGPGSDLEAEAGFWQCASCTYANHDMAANSCEMCDTRRPAR